MLGGCQSQSNEDFREKGRAKTRSLVGELRKIRTKDQLIVQEIKLQEAFASFAGLVDEVRHFRSLHPQLEPPPMTSQDKEMSDQLRLEMLRISRLEGGREILDRCRAK
jgi:hypothetical protein